VTPYKNWGPRLTSEKWFLKNLAPWEIDIGLNPLTLTLTLTLTLLLKVTLTLTLKVTLTLLLKVTLTLTLTLIIEAFVLELGIHSEHPVTQSPI